MMVRASRFGTVLGLALCTAGMAAACGGGKVTTGTAHGGTGGGGAGGNGTGTGGNGSGTGGNGGSSLTLVGSTGSSGSSGTGGAVAGLDVEPSALQTITVTAGQTMPTVKYTATLDGQPISAGWGVDKGNVATIPAGPASTALFAPSGTAGGLVTVSAGLNGKTVQRQVLVKLVSQQNGPLQSETGQVPTTVGQLTAGGGVGGVGGEGLGGAVTDPATQAALGAPTSNGSAQGLAFLYPYDKTVWPRGLLAPLLMWTWAPPGGAAAPGDADAIQITLKTTTGSFSYTGTFARPAILTTTGGKFIRMPIPQDVWDMATNTAGGAGDQLTLGLTVAKGGVAYGPITQTYTIAEARLSGTIYYQSYGTQLVQNYPGAVGGNKMFGAAVLSIHVGDTAPKVVAGTAATSPTGCRVCHAVASGGARLVVVDGNNESLSSAYDLSATPATETIMTNIAQYPAMYPDGSLALTEGGQILPLPTGAPPTAPTGLAGVFPDLGEPAFSPDGTMIAFNPRGLASKPNQTLWVMSFAKATSTFSGATMVADDSAQPAATQPGWPGFFPDSKSVVYHHQTVTGVGIEGNLGTRGGQYAQIYWTSLKSPTDVTPLDNLNGKGYLPKLPAPGTLSCLADSYSVAANPTAGLSPNLDHSDDVDMNYEPTVNPVASGGYAWVVFTSRRMYGSEATIPPFCSDPRGVDLIQNITPKKLWVAAIDLSQAPGTDSSHPAFYLPAQELLAGNARGFWTLDPCQADGTTCKTGDQCCNGYCEAGDGGLVCSNTPPNSTCAGLSDKCTTAADCCDTTNLCINGFCSQSGPQ